VDHPSVRRGREASPVTTDDTIEIGLTEYRHIWAAVNAIVAASPTLDQRSVMAIDSGTSVTLRWILAHLLEETARHAGHADILRELIDGVTGR
jgi:hypothetical protein